MSHHDGSRRHPSPSATGVRQVGVPFSIAHRYASELARYGCGNGKRPADLTDAELAGLYADVLGSPPVIDIATIREAMDPRRMVVNRRGLGGSQPDSVRAMLAQHRRSLAESRDWLVATRARLDVARDALDAAFRGLM